MFRRYLFPLYVLSLTQFGCHENGEVDADVYGITSIADNHVFSDAQIMASASSLDEALEIAQEHGLRIVTTYRAISALRNRWYGVFERISLNKDSVESVIAEMKSRRKGLIAEPDYQASLFAVPNDPKFSKLWGMHDSSDCDIDAVEAWDINTGSPEIVVGVIDTGLNYDHPDLSANVWTNPNEIAGNGIDDDNNGYIDDIHGINGINDSGDPADDHSHGSHCSGTIGGVGNNGIGVAGVCWNVKIMGLKFLNHAGTGDTSNAVKCIDYAIDQKLRGQNIVALNNSWGGLPFGQALSDAIETCNDVGIVFVVAAGNGGSDQIGDDNDAEPVYPASFALPNVMSVAATTDNDTMCRFSNYGSTSVDLGAPGIGIYSTKLGSTYGTKSGTSMACPHVTGAIALVAAEFPTEAIAARIRRITDSVDRIPSLSGKCVTGGRLNVFAALSSSGNSPKASFTYETSSHDLSVALTDTSTSDSGNIVSWDWNFGDGDRSSLRNVTHLYARADTYTVTLTVGDDDSKTDSISRQVAVSGGSGGDYASLPYNTGFEDGSFDQYWSMETENRYGRISITESNTPNSGNNHVTMDVSSNGNYCTNGALLHVDLSGESQVDLSFYWKEFGDEDNTEDGVFFSDTGGSGFQKVYDLTDGSTTYRKINIDVDQLASSRELSLSSTFVIKFQQRDNYAISSDGFAFDDISVTSGGGGGNQTPIADANGPYTGTAGNAISFSSAGSDDLDGSISSYEWDFGDGSTSTSANPVHTYSSDRTYVVSLTVTDNEGAIDTDETAAVVNDGGSISTIGNTEVFSGTSTSGTRRAMPFTMQANGFINSVTMYHKGGSGKMILAVYDGADSPENRLGVTAEVDVNSSDGWQTIELTGDVYMQSGATFWLAWVYESNLGIKYKSGSPGRADAGEIWAGGMPDPYGNSSKRNYVYSIYATWTPESS